ncbi:MAG: hypothetical protein B6229_02405 [Spirochaetaceae bacterium 4572_7]|nr:MAG: hypothetical protein B6229_02405 [Spirochaetaceae bacterium 4572_7]
MELILKIIFLLIILIAGLLANRFEKHIKPVSGTNPILFNIGRILSYTGTGVILGLLGFLIKINGVIGAGFLFIFTFGTAILALSCTPLFPKILIVGLHSHHHSKKSLLAGFTNVFASSATLHIVMIMALAHGFYIESGIMMLTFALGLLISSNKKSHVPTKVSVILQGLFFLFSSLFTLNKGLLYGELYLFSPMESMKEAIVPEVLADYQYLKTNIADLHNRILVGNKLPINWIIQGNKSGDKIYIPKFKYESILNSGFDNILLSPTHNGFIYFTGELGKGDYIIKVIDNITDVYNLNYKKVMDSGFDDAIGDGVSNPDDDENHNRPSIISSDPGISIISNNTQNITVNITTKGYDPSIIVLKKGIPAVINFVGLELTEENKRIKMPSYNEQLEFIPGDNPVNIPDPLMDFSYFSWKGNFGGYILVVDDLEGMTSEKVERQIRMFNASGL